MLNKKRETLRNPSFFIFYLVPILQHLAYHKVIPEDQS